MRDAVPFPCFVCGTLVLTRGGYKPIEEIIVGDEVLTHLGRWRRVTAVMSRRDAPLRRVRAQGVDVTTTDEHPFWVRERTGRVRVQGARARSFDDPRWVAAAALTKDHFLAQIIPEVEPDGKTVEFWWLVGRYLADGWRVRRKNRRDGSGKVMICCAHAEADELRERIAAAGFHVCALPLRRSTVSFQIHVNSLYRFLEPFGHLAHGKTLPGFALTLSREKSVALLDGYMSGDGSFDRCGARARATTVSKRLAFGMALLAQRAGVVASVRRDVPPKTAVIEGRLIRQKPIWCVTVPRRNWSGFVEGRHGWKLIRRSERHGRGTVYNISVEEDESYMADGAIAHNCNPDSGLVEAASFAVAAFVSEWVARGYVAVKVFDAMSAAVVEVRRRNSGPAGNEELAKRLDAVVESGGLPPPEPEDDLLGGTDLDLPEGGV